MNSELSALLALKVLKWTLPSNPPYRTHQTLTYDPDQGTISRELADACITIGIDPYTFLDLHPMMKQELRRLSKLPKIQKNDLNKVRRLKELIKIWQANDCRCYLCGAKMGLDKVTRDHVYPKKHGFWQSNNIMPAHADCNMNKGDDWPTLQQIMQARKAYRRIGRWFNPKTSEDMKLKLRISIRIDIV